MIKFMWFKKDKIHDIFYKQLHALIIIHEKKKLTYPSPVSAQHACKNKINSIISKSVIIILHNFLLGEWCIIQ